MPAVFTELWNQLEVLLRREHEPHWLQLARKAALHRYAELVAGPAQEPPSTPETNPGNAGTTTAPDAEFELAPEHPVWVPVPKHMHPEGHPIQVEPGPAAEALPLLAAAERDSDTLFTLLACRPEALIQPELAVNLALFTHGVVLRLPSRAICSKPIYIVHQIPIGSPTNTGSGYFVRTIILAEENAQGTIVEHFPLGTSAGEVAPNVNAVTQLVLATGAKISYCRVQNGRSPDAHSGTVMAQLQHNARITMHLLECGTGGARLGVQVLLAGAGAHAAIDGLVLGRNTSVHEIRLVMEHLTRETTGQVRLHAVLADIATAAIRGRVYVAPGAQKTDAQFLNRNLVLGQGAAATAEPQLEIHADDVKCSHGSATGYLDPSALFYLQARALPERTARRILTRAFAMSTLETVPNPGLRTALEHLLDRKLSIMLQ